MSKGFKKFKKDESGQAMVIIALFMVVLMGFTAFAVDLGNVAYQKSSLQNAADAAALAGGHDLPDVSTALTSTNEYVSKNLGNQTYQIISANAVSNVIKMEDGTIVTATAIGTDEIKVEIGRVIPYTFARVIGFSDTKVTPLARVKYTPAESANIYSETVIESVSWNGQALPLLNTGEQYEPGDTIILRTNTSPGDKSQFFEFYTKTDAGNNKTYFVDYSDGLKIDQGNGNTKSNIDDTSLKDVMRDVIKGAKVGDVFYVLSIKADILDDYYSGVGFNVTRGGITTLVTSANGGLHQYDIIDKEYISLLKCTYKDDKNEKDIEMVFTGTEYDIAAGESPIGFEETTYTTTTISGVTTTPSSVKLIQ